MKTGLSHETQETNGFKRYCFTSGIGSCYYEKVKFSSKLYINGNNLLPVYERMTGFLQYKIMLPVVGRPCGIHLKSQLSSCKYHIKGSFCLLIE
jgi:hypothetical protein